MAYFYAEDMRTWARDFRARGQFLAASGLECAANHMEMLVNTQGPGQRQPPETVPLNVPVIVAGGIAMKKTDGQWFTGMEEPLYQRPLEWTPKWWMAIPEANNVMAGKAVA